VTSPFFSLNIGASALRTAQTLVDITNQNVSNANTPGYSRQTADVKASPAFPIPTFSNTGIPGQLGSGVQIADVSRARDAFIDYQMRGQLTSQGRWDVRRDALKQVEAVTNEPSSNGLSSLMTKYWQAWQEVANSPSDAATRASLIEQGKSVADAFNNQSQQLLQQQRDLDQQAELAVTDVNNYADQISKINLQIARVETAGMHANDLRDQRDQLLDKLSSLVKINYTESADGQVSVYVGNRQLVDRDVAHKMEAVTPPGQKYAQIEWASDGKPVTLQDGKLQGILEARDDLVQGQLDQLNALAARVIDSVNSLHTSGVGLDGKSGVKFFDGTDAGSISIDPALSGPNGTDHVAAAQMTYASGTYTFARGDSSNAVAIGELGNAVSQRDLQLDALPTTLKPGGTYGTTSVLGLTLSSAPSGTSYTLGNLSFDAATSTASDDSGTIVNAAVTSAVDANDPTQQIVTLATPTFRITLRGAASDSINTVLGTLNGKTFGTASAPSTIGDQYGRQIASLGVDASTATNQSSNQQVLIDHLTTQQQQVSGVSLDEETTNLIQYQHAYQAAARVISVVDDMLDTLINNTGRVGR
jgi:flagellar hook-associated protein 1 FlgK